MSKKKLIPPDKERCQAEKSNGHNFMTFGGVPDFIRCIEKPVIIITERKAEKDGVKGSMSLCNSCWKQFIFQNDVSTVNVEPI